MSFKQYYDLVFRARNALLNSTCYQLDFLDWIKAGIAFNTRGCELSTRKIAMFAGLYTTLSQCVDEGDEPVRREKEKFSNALVYFYEDILTLYENHIESQQLEVRTKRVKTVPNFGEVLIVPSFACVPWMGQVFETRVEHLTTYQCKHNQEFRNYCGSPYLKEDTDLYRSMSMMYDYGAKQAGRDVLLEVTLWDEIK